jgi:acetolactate synthase-1/3 small subunit
MKQTLNVLVEDKPGVLNRVSSLFRRRNFNIESLAVGHTHEAGVSRMTIVTDEEERLRRNVVKQNLLKLVNVIEVEDVTDSPCVFRETALIKVAADATSRAEIMNITEIYRARIVDVATESMIVEVTGDSNKIDALADLLRPFQVIEMARTGQLAMTRGTVALRQGLAQSQKNGNR